MDLLQQAEVYENRTMSHMSTSDRVAASREGNKKTKDSHLMEVMKRLTVKKKKIEKRIKGRLAA